MAHNPYDDGKVHQPIKFGDRNKLQGILREHGLTGVARYLADAVRRRLDPEWRRRMRGYAAKDRVDRDFDRRYGVNTWGDILLDQLGIAQQDLERGNGLYRPIDEKLFWEAISLLQIDPSEFHFIDYGSGKGKVLVMASHLPFRSVIGIEFSPVLHEAAIANLCNFHRTDYRCGEISAECGDAIEYSPPGGPLVCFFFNPFSPEVWVEVLEKLRSSWEAEPRPLYVVYTNQRTVEELGTVLSDCDFLEPYARRQRVLVYRAREMAVA
jgi:SAM-dependent methyltransferase